VRVAAPALMEVARQWAERERGAPLLQLARGVGERMALVPGLGALVAERMTASAWEWHARESAEVLRRFDRERMVALLPTEMRRWYDLGWVGSITAIARAWDHKPLPEELGAAVERVARGNWLVGDIHQALVALRTRDVARFDRVVEAMVRADESLVCLPEVQRHLHARRQDLLDPFLGHRVIKGRFATGKTRWILPFDNGFHRWNAAQSARFHETLAGLVADQDRDTPTVFRALVILPRLEFAPADALCALADDKRPAVREKAIRVMARCDAAQGVPTLLACLDDARARFAIYGLRRALRDVPPARVVSLLAGVSLRKVTVAKEVLRLLGELRHDAAYDLLLELDGRALHRDVRIALLRALWDHLEREPTWAVLARAVAADDWVMASRLGDIPADRLTVTSDRRLSALLAQVLDRPEPEARIDLLQRAHDLAVRDPDRALLRACGARLASPYDDEVRAAMMALLHRADEGDMAALGPMVSAVREDVRALTVALTALIAAPLRTRAVWTQAGAAVERALEGDARLTPLRVRCASAWRSPADWAAWARALLEGGATDADTVQAVEAGLANVPAASLRGVIERWRASPSPAVRRAAVSALVRDAGPTRGWTPERLDALRALQADPAAEVAGAARAVFPPREMIDERYRERGPTRPRVKDDG
jgi:cellulose synthase operon protein C